jgi:lysophospholipase L1-like esterase
MRSACIVPSDFLERIAKPSSRFHPDYLAYRGCEISYSELIDRLPHVTLLGDSVCTGIHISTPWSTVWRARRRRDRNWFLNVDPSTPIHSVCKRLEKLTPLIVSHHGGIGAMVDDESDRVWFSRRILGTRNFSGQIDQLKRSERFPDLILISIGHNNVDWAWRCPPNELKKPNERLHRQCRHFRKIFARNLQRLVDHARRQDQRLAILVFGLVNFESYFRGRAEAEELRAKDPSLYPHLETTYEYLLSFHPDYRENLIRLAKMVNDEMRSIVDEFNRDLSPMLQLRYSDALAQADLSRAELLHEIDGWHASVQGHNVLAAAAFEGLKPSLEFLGITWRATL